VTRSTSVRGSTIEPKKIRARLGATMARTRPVRVYLDSCLPQRRRGSARQSAGAMRDGDRLGRQRGLVGTRSGRLPRPWTRSAGWPEIASPPSCATTPEDAVWGIQLARGISARARATTSRSAQEGAGAA
jgi:hypothetical protein